MKIEKGQSYAILLLQIRVSCFKTGKPVKYYRLVWFLFLTVLLAAGWTAVESAPIYESQLQPAWQQPVPTPASTTPDETRGTSPIVGIAVLLAPFAWLIWRSVRQKQLQKIKSGACLPVMDPNSPPLIPKDK